MIKSRLFQAAYSNMNPHEIKLYYSTHKIIGYLLLCGVFLCLCIFTPSQWYQMVLWMIAGYLLLIACALLRKLFDRRVKIHINAHGIRIQMRHVLHEQQNDKKQSRRDTECSWGSIKHISLDKHYLHIISSEEYTGIDEVFNQMEKDVESLLRQHSTGEINDATLETQLHAIQANTFDEAKQLIRTYHVKIPMTLLKVNAKQLGNLLQQMREKSMAERENILQMIAVQHIGNRL